MAFTFDQFATQAAKKSTFGNTVKQAANKVAETTVGFMPVTNKRFNNTIADLANKHSKLEREAFDTKVLTHMLAHQVGMTVPTKEELDELWEQHQQQDIFAEAPVEEVKELPAPQPEPVQEQPAQQVDPLQAVMNDPDAMAKMFAMFQQMQQQSAPVQEPLLKTDEDLQAYMTEEQEMEQAPVIKATQCIANISSQAMPTRCSMNTINASGVCDACTSAGITHVYEEDMAALTVQEEVQSEYKQCLGCEKELHVTYEADKCRDCRKAERDAKQEAPKPRNTTMRIKFDDVPDSL